MVLEWMKNGNLNQYLNANPDAPTRTCMFSLKVSLSSLKLTNANDRTSHVAGRYRPGGPWGPQRSTLSYLCNHHHAFLIFPVKADILVGEIRRVRVTDFTQLRPATLGVSHGAVRWMSSEPTDPKQFGRKTSRATKHSDRHPLWR